VGRSATLTRKSWSTSPVRVDQPVTSGRLPSEADEGGGVAGTVRGHLDLHGKAGFRGIQAGMAARADAVDFQPRAAAGG